ncbi:YfiR family protein [Reichenbachiella versicolor]|uniref:YfiR family protein n=1 Tax=Reichenbachiella versicolor TaxID=1821036 RepID=UPI000D6E9A99|nr:YfiR family protein [Reichenbachiella versicolor]
MRIINQPNRFKFLLLSFFLLTMFSRYSGYCQNLDQYKALLLYKVSEYIIWPNEQSSRTIGVFETAGVYKNLSSFAKNKENLNILPLTTPEDANKCDIVFITEENIDILRDYARSIGNKSILLISATKTHIHKGADFVLYTEDKQLKYIFNEPKMTYKGMTASNKLSSLAQSL